LVYQSDSQQFPRLLEQKIYLRDYFT